MQPLELYGRRLFITGGTGFVGRTLLDYLIDWEASSGQAFEVTVLSRDPAAFLRRYPEYSGKHWLRFVAGNLKQLPSPAPYTDVIHAAADTHLHGQGLRWIEQIVNGTADVLEFAVRCGAGRFLHTSSGAVYGSQPQDLDLVPEEYRGAPPTDLLSSTYGEAKRLAEHLCTIYSHEHGIAAVNARCFAFSGRHLPLDGPYALGNFIRDALWGSKVLVKGDGAAVRSYLDARDMAYWLLKLLIDGQTGAAYNVGSSKAMTISAVAEKVRDILSPEKEVVIECVEVNDGSRSRYVPCTKKAKALGLEEQVSFETSVAAWRTRP